MIFILDTGFTNLDVEKSFGQDNGSNHGKNLHTIISSINPNANIKLIELGYHPDNNTILTALDYLRDTYDSGIITISLTVYRNKDIDEKIDSLKDKFTFIVAAGNAGLDINTLSPACHPDVITVGSYNKSHEIASHNSVGNIDVYAPGTNINVDGYKISGTSVAMAIYAGFYSVHNNLEEAQQAIEDQFMNLIFHLFKSDLQEDYDHIEKFRWDPVEYIVGKRNDRVIPGVKIFESMIACAIPRYEEELRENLRLNKKIILNAYPEGFYHMGRAEDFLIEVFEDMGKNIEEDLVIVTGSVCKRLIEKSKLRKCYSYGPYIADWTQGVEGREDTPDCSRLDKKEKTFLSFNRVLRSHRAAIVAEMIKRDIIDDNYVSYFNLHENRQNHLMRTLNYKDKYAEPDPMWSKEVADEYYDILKDIDSIYIDEIDPTQNQATTFTPVDFYEKSFFSLVNETFFFHDDEFPTEKIFKPILYKHPFIVTGCHGFLRMLRDMGFKTFSPWINESYDDVKDGHQRIQAIMDEVERLTKLPHEEKCQMITEMQDVLEHNRKVFLDKKFIKRNSNFTSLKNLLDDQFSYVLTYEPKISFILDLSLDNDECDVISNLYQESDIAKLHHIIKTNPFKKIIIDFSKEIVYDKIYDELKDYDDLSNVMVIGHKSGHNAVSEEICLMKGLVIDFKDHFVDNKQVYQPTPQVKNVEHKVYTLFTGKTRPHRTALIGLLSYYNLLEYGHVSYFGDLIDNNFSHHKVADLYNIYTLPEELKRKIKEGMDKLTLPLTLDVSEFKPYQAHTTEYDPTYYNACDFVVAVETEFGETFPEPFITEKPIKALNMRKKVMTLGQKGYTQKLFSSITHKETWRKEEWNEYINWVDHSTYDNEPNEWKRLELFVEELRRQIEIFKEKNND